MITSFAKYHIVGFKTAHKESRGTSIATKGEQVEFDNAFFVPRTAGLDRSYNGDMERWEYDVYIEGNVPYDMYSFILPEDVVGESRELWVNIPARHFKSPTGLIDFTIYGVGIRKG